MEAVVDRLREGAASVHQVWLPPLPPAITLDQVAWAGAGELRVPIGLIDVPAQQSQEPLMLDFAGTGGHLAVVGASQTGKSTLLRTLLAAFIHTHSPKDVQFYCVDLGGGGLRAFEGAPHVGAVCGKLEPDKVRRLVREMRAVVDERELSFRELGIDSMAAYRRRRDRGELDASPYGDVFLVIDNWALLHQEFEGLDAEVAEIAANGLHYGVHVILSSSRWADVRSSLRDHIGNRLELRLNDPADSEVSRAAAQALPANVPGRGLTGAGLQFQVALPRLDGQPETTQLQQAIGELVERAGKTWPGVAAPPIRMLPTLVERSALAQATFVVEAVVEDHDVKASLLAELDAIVDADAILASTTSSLSVARLAQASGRADRFVGLHVFNPVTKMDLIEVIFPRAASAERTSSGIRFSI